MIKPSAKSCADMGKSAEQTIQKGIKLSFDQGQEILDVLNMVLELQILSENADDQPWTILKMMADKAAPLAEDLHQQLPNK